MSIAFLSAVVSMARDGISPENEMLFIWALFAIADALWLRLFFKD